MKHLAVPSCQFLSAVSKIRWKLTKVNGNNWEVIRTKPKITSNQLGVIISQLEVTGNQPKSGQSLTNIN